MKKLLLSAASVLLAAALTACVAASSAPAATPVPTQTPAVTAAPEPTAEATTEEAETANSNILIAYFTWAENTVVEDPSAVDVDATTSASVLMPGNAGKLADWIWQEVGGDLFSIRVAEPYSSNYDESYACRRLREDQGRKASSPGTNSFQFGNEIPAWAAGRLIFGRLTV